MSGQPAPDESAIATGELAEDFSERYVTAQDGLRLYVRDYDRHAGLGNTPVLCLPGLVRNSADFHRLASRLSQHRRVICPDFRGRGRSDRDANWENYNPFTYLSDLHHIRAALNLHRMVVFGVSMGGIMTMALGAMAASSLAGAVIIDIGPVVDQTGLGRIGNYVGKDIIVADWDAALARLRETWQRNGRWSDRDWEEMTRATFRRNGDGMLHVDWDTNISRALDGQSSRQDLWAVFRSLSHVPVVLVRGENSDILAEDTYQKMLAMLPDVHGVLVPDVGHVPMPHDPNILVALDTLLERCDAQGG